MGAHTPMVLRRWFGEYSQLYIIDAHTHTFMSPSQILHEVDAYFYLCFYIVFFGFACPFHEGAVHSECLNDIQYNN